ncbi:dapper homolog 2 [Dunckerocampus dactyliophorus]|uniref:dapper homolog 2 n=1 Tax=Dunckerocampus dactyliophorus TaxID=161453 RepID=UPI0024056DE1|nr:dapper homolog 2 [Dunckerocampus dactyliophorus]XP_054654859.1 dapper homolog 2 [Dunckerocampus dactyliophorus]
MLSTKGSCVGMMSAAVGMDRSRVGERLQAALAGLQELHLLRERQSDMVSWALKVDREEPFTCVHPGPEETRMMGAEEQRLEATLTALKQQLSRLRKQDVGLKTHLQQLDQQISELKLDVSKASTEQLESDSRPSSGFYELSDGGSCSLSNSCTSVYSECLSSSQTSLLLPTTSPANSQVCSQYQTDVHRRRSADESATQPNAARGIHLGSSRIRASSAVAEHGRPRPVSTGDLDRMMTQGLSYKSVDTKKQPMCPNLKIPTMDPKFQSNLVSRSGIELYHYPSPLHAVALQSPIFFHVGEPAIPGFAGGTPVTESDTLQATEMGYDTKTLGYIDKLLQRSSSKSQIEMSPEAVQTHSNYQRKPTEVVTVFPQKPVSPPQPPPTQAINIIPQDNEQRRHRMTHSSPETTDNAGHQQSVRPQGVSYGPSYPAVMREYSSDEVTVSSLRKKDKTHVVSRGHTQKTCGDNSETRLVEKKGYRQRTVMSHSSSAEDSQGFEMHNGHTGSPEFVHAKFVPAGTQRVKVRQADRKTKAVKLRRKSSEKPRALRQQHGYSSGERTRESSGSKGEARRSAKGKMIQKYASCPTEEHKQGSGSDSSQCGPGLMYTHKVQSKPHPLPSAPKSSKSRRSQCGEHEQPLEQRKKRHGEKFQALWAQRQRSKDLHSQAPGSMHLVRSMSTRSGQWIGPPRSFMTSMSANSFHTSLNARYPPAPYRISSHYPPRCESEYSAECMSLFHSTIAASSDGEMSDNTTNRFGDSESSQSFQSFSDSDSSLSLDEGDQLDSLEEEGDLVWAEASLGPTAAGRTLQQLPRPEPSACRIKASRALKKKIRRFQPASLKVMTLV